MRDLHRREFLAGTVAGIASLAASSSVSAADETSRCVIQSPERSDRPAIVSSRFCEDVALGLSRMK